MTVTDTTDGTAKVAELLKDFRFAMLTTVDEMGKLVAHPLTVQEREFDGDLWFVIGRNASAVTHIALNPSVGVSLSSNDSWVSLSGTAELVDDHAKLEELWNGAIEAWFPEGPSDPNVTLLKFSADSAEYWDSPGGKVASLMSFVKSKVTGESLDADNEKVDL
ncbi:pyridoxamine 5'-phosphate oxidase [Labedella populi]|uniref:Pyridoxamine 5'-phosphate oxidase n=1 Tax=Labedella populi TaxID=2498850 RepID=A0A444QGH7_9MICO|nr:pyridoxamine 5'-phosphate oxidase [Labedella populi]